MSGRLPQQMYPVPDSPERFAAQITDPQELNHIGVFMTGQAPFPEGYGATLHLQAPGKGWELIGGLTNERPSAFFRLRGTFIPSGTSFSSTSFGPAAATAAPTSSSTATLGILCEPLESVNAQLAALGTSATAIAANPATSTALVPARGGAGGGGPDPVKLAQLVGKNLFNAVAGFAQPLPGGQAGQWLPFEAIERWYREFERKLKTTGVGFLLNTD
ncbi:hypothetical protein JCM10908_000313 [Rhodotorula pacifica]|uniref:Opi10p n=1 Tax=Rhodotorula pacifica TaxID=1495444 RepID=UPI0031726D3A